MYGDFLVSIKANVKGENTYFPIATWCTTHSYAADPDCFNSTGISTQLSQRLFYFKSGSIIPLQSVFGKDSYAGTKPVNTTKDLVNLPIDIHINPQWTTDGSVLFSKGALLYYSDQHDEDPHCYVEINHH